MTAPLADLGGGVVLRRAVVADLPAVVALLTDDPLGATREAAGPEPYERAFAAVDADPAHLLVVADDGGMVIGTLQLSFLPGLSRGGALRAQVEGVRVAAAARGRGLGEAMLRWCADEARRRGAALVQLTTDTRRADAHRFYERLGYVASHVGMKLEL
ncbi:Acetyltransferase (GNAT) family protein [Geodermatophilus obscurus]|uniref:Acetyltransferase (GNAT) family protein n=1 Tax=Geodermatophilus obscurus TaxID=1861 RepID=A0A1I5IHB3_9ACTN|nr:GNAT family N-acetyltransferase [Geodermatophilus obscurus]SFO59809.1 Acetyltransferase (GNAT) family protein [Geodermatophilus obscurus]